MYYEDTAMLKFVALECSHSNLHISLLFHLHMLYSYYTFQSSIIIWLSGLECHTGCMENNLRLCEQSRIGQNSCIHSKDIILSCFDGGMY